MVSITLRPTLPPVKTGYPLYRRLGGPQGRSGHMLKISTPPGFDPRTVQPVASPYTDYATRPKITQKRAVIIWIFFVKQKKGKILLLFSVQMWETPQWSKQSEINRCIECSIDHILYRSDVGKLLVVLGSCLE